MANKIIIQDSQTPGAVPTSIPLGQLNLNNPDAKIYLSKGTATTIQALGQVRDRFAGELFRTADSSLGPPSFIRADGTTYPSGVYPALDSIYGTAIGGWDSGITKLATPSSIPTGGGCPPAYSGDGNYLAMGMSASPYLIIYKRVGDTYTKLPDPASMPPNLSRGVALSSDGTYLAVSCGSSPYLIIYKRSGDVFTRLTGNINVLPGGGLSGYSVAISSDDLYFALLVNSPGGGLWIYKRSGDNLTRISAGITQPASYAIKVDFSKDTTYLAVSSWGSPYIHVYKRAGDVFTKLADPTPAAGGGNSQYSACSFSPDGTYLVTSGPRIYKRSGDTFTGLSGLSMPDMYGASWTPDGTYLATALSGTPFIGIFKRAGDVFTRMPDLPVLPTQSGYGVAFSPDGQHLAADSLATPWLNIYKSGAAVSTTVPNIANPDAQSRIMIYTGS